jgi:alkylated DNA repair dioxygenase AlkB
MQENTETRVPGVWYEGAFVTEPQALYERLVAEVDWDERIRARKTATFGSPYNYSGMTYETAPMHPLLVPIVDRLETRLGFRPNNCLLNYYPDGDSTMGFHRDSTDDLMPGTGVAIVSLGNERALTFRHHKKQDILFPYPLASGSLLYMPPEVQDDWLHGVRKQSGTGGRISLTFRQVASPE